MKSDSKKRKTTPSKQKKGQPKKAARKQSSQVKPAAPPVPDPGSDVELDEDDLAIFEEFGKRVDFLAAGEIGLKAEDAPKSATAKASVSQPKTRPGKGATSAATSTPAGAPDSADETENSSGSDEEEYERKARSNHNSEQANPSVDLLPFKTQTGELIYAKSKPKRGRLAVESFVPGVSIVDDAAGSDEDVEELDDSPTGALVNGTSDATNGVDATDTETRVVLKSKRKAGARHDALKEAATYHSKTARREDLSQQIAVAASKLLETPQEQLPSLRMLLELALDSDAVVQRLAVLSLSSVFKDILPGYRIRDLTDVEEEVKVTKAVQKLRDYERTLVKAFQSYVKLLSGMLKSKTASINHRRVAVKCLRELLTSVPHFNHMNDVLQALVPAAASGDARMRRDACAALSTLLRGGRHGAVMLDAVQLVADLVRVRKCVCHPDIVRALLVLPFKDIMKADVEKGSKALERRYKFKKRRQREDAIAAALQEAAAAADADQARLQQSQMLEALFELFFRVLKRCTASGLLQAAAGERPSEDVVREKFPLLYVALEGLGMYTHLVGLEYFTDLLEVFHQLLSRPALPLTLRLRCLLSTVDILSAQGDALNVDRRQIYMHLYSAIAESPMEHIQVDVADDDAGVEGPREGADAEGAGDREDRCSVLVAKAASRLLGWLKVGDSARLGAFAKRLCSSALHAEPGLAVALVSIASRIIRRHMRLHGMLEGECVGSYGSGGYDPHIADPSEARALASTLWELPMLLNHFHPAVAQCASAAAAVGSDSAALSVEGALHALEPHVLACRYAYRQAGLMCEVPAKAPGRQSGVAVGKKGAAPRGSPVITALAAHYIGTADASQECGLDCPPEMQLAGQELAGMFGQTRKQWRKRLQLRQVRKKVFACTNEEASSGDPPTLPTVSQHQVTKKITLPGTTQMHQAHTTTRSKNRNPMEKGKKKSSKKCGAAKHGVRKKRA